MAKQRLDHTDINPSLKQMRSEAMAQRSHRDRLGDAGRVGCLMKQSVLLPCRQRPVRATAWKEIALLGLKVGIVLGLPFAPIVAQEIEDGVR